MANEVTFSGPFSKEHRLILCTFYRANTCPKPKDYNLLAKILNRSGQSIRSWFKRKRRFDRRKIENLITAEPVEEIEITVNFYSNILFLYF
jgi:hypothetical protein